MNLYEILLNFDFLISKILFLPSPYSIYFALFTETTFFFYLLFAYILIKRKSSRWKKMFFYAFFGYLVVFLLKIIFNRPRPYEELQVFSTIQKFEKSFPSSHAFLSALLINFVPNENWKKYFIFYTILVSISLIISGVHYLSDVLVGALLGFIFPRYILPEKKLENIKILK